MKVVLVIADSLRADAPGYAGGAAKTPFLDALAAGGAWFEEAFASGAWTIPSVLSMLTGALPHEIGVARWRHPFPGRLPTLFDAFAEAGFEVRTFHPYPLWGYVNTPGAGAVGDSQDPDAVIAALRAGGSDSFFLIHHWWTHLPYLDRRLPVDQWHATCDFTLESLGRYPERITATVERSYGRSVHTLSESLLPRYLEAAAGGGGDTLFVLVGDHGETWGRSLPKGRRVENVYDLHGRWIADETIRIPFLVHGRGAAGAIPARPAIPGIARGVDVGATIAELAGVPWKGGAQCVGESLAGAVIRGDTAKAEEIVTVTSQNAHTPNVFPATGKGTWRTFGLRDRRGWFVWDGIDGTREIALEQGGRAPSAADCEAVWARLEACWNRAADPGAPLPDGELARLRGLAKGDSARAEERLRTLGYLD